MFAFDEFFSLGFEPGDPMLDFWESSALGYALAQPAALGKNDYKRLTGRSLVLLNWKDEFYRADLLNLYETGASVFAHLPIGFKRNAGAVIDCIHPRMPDCCTPECARDPARKIGQSPSVKERLSRIMSGTAQIYGEIALSRPDGRAIRKPGSVFVATPYDPKLYDPFLEGVGAAMRAIGMEIVNPRDAGGNALIGQKVRDDIDRCDFLLANLRNRVQRYEWSRNANVWYEIGYAWKANKPVLFWGHKDDQFRLPADLDGYECLTYCDAVHLALQLFYGFGGHETSRVP